ncbi:MAG TPA: SMP-30/gluconolactonase/LRE family protein [Alphaproteobacteria bacterium]|nr:SMP-30/gluconolactonase/LRE family protein [Alphaproteobacteria bacterium]
MPNTKILMDGLCFPEGPRWHDGRLWFSDMHGPNVIALGLDGKSEIIATVENSPSGLGWLPDGRLLIVSMRDRKLLVRGADGKLSQHADLSKLASFDCNDMVVDAKGRAYVGNFGYDLHNRAPRKNAEIILVTPDGKAQVAATDIQFPNGTVITPDGKTLIVGESMGACLTAFDIAPDGSLSNRRLWAKMEGALPDGIALDAEGGIWVASPISGACLRVVEGGKVTDKVEVENQAFACALGGPDRKTLFLATAKDSHPVSSRESRTGRIETITVKVAGAGWP